MIKSEYDIHKAAAIILKDRKALLTRTKGKNVFVPPGGKLEQGETEKQALIRELKEELNITVSESNLEEFGTFYADAAGQVGMSLKMAVYSVSEYQGQINPQSEIEEIMFVDSVIPSDIEVGSIFLHDVLPRLKTDGLVD